MPLATPKNHCWMMLDVYEHMFKLRTSWTGDAKFHNTSKRLLTPPNSHLFMHMFSTHASGNGRPSDTKDSSSKPITLVGSPSERESCTFVKPLLDVLVSLYCLQIKFHLVMIHEFGKVPFNAHFINTSLAQELLLQHLFDHFIFRTFNIHLYEFFGFR